jgi:glycosyltransferase involved in cell wall biosynthesis
MSRHFHIVCLDVPFPADYGGAIDMLHRIEALYREGVQIHLHYFHYRDDRNPNELNRYCASIHQYSRKTGWSGFSRGLPYIVSSRMNPDLLTNLLKDDYPVLLEGVHCTGWLPALLEKGKKVVVRLHNDEQAYYRQLARSEHRLWRKWYFLRESRLLGRYQRQLPPQAAYACITESDADTFRNEYGLPGAFFLPAFTPYREVRGAEGMGSFCLYHGNLSVPENEKAALWLLEHVFSKIKVPFVVVGKNPSRRLDKMAHLYQHTCLVGNPSDGEISDLIQKAHINILPSFNSTGIKIKLLHALFEGRHCVVNEAMVKGTGLEAACHIGTNADSFASIILQLQHHPFTSEETDLRKQLLGNLYDTGVNARRLSPYLW